MESTREQSEEKGIERSQYRLNTRGVEDSLAQNRHRLFVTTTTAIRALSTSCCYAPSTYGGTIQYPIERRTKMQEGQDASTKYVPQATLGDDDHSAYAQSQRILTQAVPLPTTARLQYTRMMLPHTSQASRPYLATP